MEKECLKFGAVTVESVKLGPIETNVYLVSKDDSVVVVDPAAAAHRIDDLLEERRVSDIIITHAHFDHVGAAELLREEHHACVHTFEPDATLLEGASKDRRLKFCPVDDKLTAEATRNFAGISWQVFHTPGHSKGSSCWYISPEQTDGATGLLFSGDTLFYHTIGRTDFEGGSMEDMLKSLNKLAKLPDATIVFPGHGKFSSIANERECVFYQYIR